MLITEIRIPVPWGYVAAKSWGNPGNCPVLCVHGIQDNANTFDRLIPLLPSSFFYVCIDLPGHGLSSNFPCGIILDFLDYVFVLKRIINYFQWKKVIYMAHSLGAQLGAYFAALYPNNVAKLIMLDAVAPFCVSSEQYWERQRQMISGLLKIERKMTEREAPQYTYVEAVNRLKKNRFSKISQQGAEILTKRSVLYNDGFSYTTDQRLKLALLVHMEVKQQLSILSQIKCPQLLIVASETVPFFKMSVFKQIISLYERRSNFVRVIVEGSHDVHLDHPERVADIISKFLTRKRSSL